MAQLQLVEVLPLHLNLHQTQHFWPIRRLKIRDKGILDPQLYLGTQGHMWLCPKHTVGKAKEFKARK